MKPYSPFLFLVGAIILASCSKQTEPAAPAKVEHAPDVFRVKFETSKGDFVVQVNKEWAPLGADRFFELVQSRFFDGGRFFRVMPRFMVQFGINGDPKVSELWANARLKDDPVKQSNTKGRITFATSGPSSRTTEVFINYVDNARLDKQGFAPFGEVVSGMDAVEKFYSAYGDVAPRGNGPNQSYIETQGNDYLERSFPRLDSIKKASVE
jgi:peptidyl-prolyl cis-trans isomerase A (cyclophilin A)